MHERALRRRKKVVRSSRVPLRRRGVRRASTRDATRHTDANANANADTTDAQTRAAPHRAPERRARGRRWPGAHAESESVP